LTKLSIFTQYGACFLTHSVDINYNFYSIKDGRKRDYDYQCNAWRSAAV